MLLPSRLDDKYHIDSSKRELYRLPHDQSSGGRQPPPSKREGRSMAAPLKVEFHFDFGSPNAYLAELALTAIEQRTGVRFDYVPVLLGGVYKATGNMSPAESLREIKNKPEYNALETQRFLRRHNITRFQ